MFVCSETFPKSSHISKSDHKHSLYLLEEGPGLGQDPGFLGYEFKISDRNIDLHINGPSFEIFTYFYYTERKIVENIAKTE
jgi:hypothetical protein